MRNVWFIRFQKLARTLQYVYASKVLQGGFCLGEEVENAGSIDLTELSQTLHIDCLEKRTIGIMRIKLNFVIAFKLSPW